MDNNFVPSPALIHKVATNKAVVETFNDAFEIGKVKFNFQSFEDSTVNIQIYLDIADFVALCNDIKNGTAANLANYYKQNKITNKAIYQFMGGTPFAKQKNKRSDGRDESRILSIIPSTLDKYIFTIKAEKGPGTEEGTGIIKPDYKAGRFESVMIPISAADVKGLFILTEMRYQAYLTAQMMKGAFDRPVYNDQSTEETQNVPRSNYRQAEVKNVVPITRSNEEMQGKTYQSRYGNKTQNNVQAVEPQSKPQPQAQSNEIIPTPEEIFPQGSFEDMYPDYFNKAM